MLDIKNAGVEELDSIKLWLFQENVRVENMRSELEIMKKELNCEKKSSTRKIKELERSNERTQRQLEKESVLFEKKWKTLEQGFFKLADDKKQFERVKRQHELERVRFEENKRKLQTVDYEGGLGQNMKLLFRGVNSSGTLKKRYKDLIKIFHPDNNCGDHDTIQWINREYSSLKTVYEIEMH